MLLTVSGATMAAGCSVPAPATPTQVVPAAGGGGATAAPTAAGAASAAAQPKMGGTLRVGAVGDVANIDPQSWGPKNGFCIFMAYDTLTTYDLELKPQPQLAESWDQTSDGKQLTVKVRKGVRSSGMVVRDGRQLGELGALDRSEQLAGRPGGLAYAARLPQKTAYLLR